MERYTAAGGPAPTGQWDAAAQTAGWKAVLAIAATGPGYLPAPHGSSGPLFEHLVDDRALTAVEASGATLQSQFETLVPLLMATQAGVKAMILGATAKEVQPDAIAMIYAHLFVAFAVVTPLFEPYLASFADDEPTLAVRRRGLEKFKTGMAIQIQGALGVLTSSETPAAAKTKLLTALGTHVPVVARTLPAELRAAILETVTKTSQAVDPDLVGPLLALAATLEPVAAPPDSD